MLDVLFQRHQPSGTFLCLVPLFSPSPLPGYGKFRKICAPAGYCSPKCRVMDMKYTSGDCKYSCCIPPAPWKGK
uniref:Beta-defensin n=1 Tax=Zosterops lateralis melanops TaxID=1220523 RepID=A0A8D2QR85_ZOSLA